MLTGISWHQYILFCGAALILYYLVLLVIYRRDIIIRFVKQYNAIERNTKRTWYPQESDINVKDKEETFQLSLFDEGVQKTALQKTDQDLSEKQNETDAYYPVVHDLVDEIEAFLHASGESSEKQEVLESLKTILQKYAVLKSTPLTKRINDLIVSDCQSYCSIHLSEGEVSELWL